MTAMTTMKVPVEVRDRLMALARGHERTLGAELGALVDEAEEREWWQVAKAATKQLRSDPEEWAHYLGEAEAWAAVSGDGLASAADEWPEYAEDRS
jgi:hypothetical protein